MLIVAVRPIIIWTMTLFKNNFVFNTPPQKSGKKTLKILLTFGLSALRGSTKHLLFRSYRHFTSIFRGSKLFGQTNIIYNCSF